MARGRRPCVDGSRCLICCKLSDLPLAIAPDHRGSRTPHLPQQSRRNEVGQTVGALCWIISSSRRRTNLQARREGPYFLRCGLDSVACSDTDSWCYLGGW